MTESYRRWKRDLASNCEFRACLETGSDTGDNGKCSASVSWNTPMMIWKSVYHQVRMSMYSSPEPEKSWDIHEDYHWTWKTDRRMFEPSTVSYEWSTSTNVTRPIHFLHLDNQLFLVCYLGDIVWALPPPVDNWSQVTREHFIKLCSIAWGQGPKYKKSWLKSLVYQNNLQTVGDISVLGKSLRLLVGETSLQPPQNST